MGKKLTVGIVILLLVVLAIFLAMRQNNPAPSGAGNTPATSQNNPTPPATNNPAQAPKPAAVDVQALLATNPGPRATQQQLKVFSANVSSYSVDANSIDVTACMPNPAVARIKMGKPLTLKNSDSVAHTLVNGSITMQSPANSSKTLTPAFTSPGIYGYSCDTKITGIFLVVP